MIVELDVIETEFTKEELAADYLRGAIQAMQGEEYCLHCGTQGWGIWEEKKLPAYNNSLMLCCHCGFPKGINDLTTVLDRIANKLEGKK
jgi:hypothetical protein